MIRRLCSMVMMWLMGAALAGAAVIFTEGFNSGFSDPYAAGDSWGARFGISAPGIVTDGSILDIEGDGVAALNNNRPADNVATIIGAMDVDLGTVTAEGVRYTFSGDFSWRYGTDAAASEVYVHAVQSGFVVGTGGATTTDSDFYFNMAQTNWVTHSFSYTTTANDVGKTIRLRIRLADTDKVGTLTQLLTDNWSVSTLAPPAWSEGFNEDFSTSIYSVKSGLFFISYGSDEGLVTPADEGGGHGFFNDNSISNGITVYSYAEVNVGTVSASGDTYTFSGNFAAPSWISSAKASDWAIDETQTGFIGSGGLVAATQQFNFGDAVGVWSNYTFSYTTSEADVGEILKIRITLKNYNNEGSLVQLVTDDWRVDGPALLALPFPAVPELFGPELISNGDFAAITNETPNPPNGRWNVTGTFGDWEGATNQTADLTGWSPYYGDPSNLVPAVGTPHVIDGNGELDGTFYLDSHITGGLVILDSVMDFKNGMMQEDIFNGQTIDPAAIYRLSVDATSVAWAGGSSNALFTAALTSGSDATNLNNAVSGSLLMSAVSDLSLSAGYPLVGQISGADLSGQINMVFEHVNTTPIPGFPGGVSSNDVANSVLVSQVQVRSVSLVEKLAPAAGDMNRDGLVNDDDLAFANSYLDGSVDGGADAATRVSDWMSLGLTASEALDALNLTEFDINGDGSFDSSDIDALAMLLVPSLRMGFNGEAMSFEWQSDESKSYAIESCSSLSLADWAVYNDGVTTYENIPGSGTGTNSLSGVLFDDPVQFFRLVEGNAPTSYIAVADGSFEVSGGSGWSACMSSWNDTGAGNYELSQDPGHMGVSADGEWSGLMSNMGTISQDLGVTVNAGDTLTITFAGGRALSSASTAAGGVFSCTLKVGNASNTVQANTTSLANGTWQSYENTWTATETGTLSIEFSNVSGTPWIDNISSVQRVIQ